MYVFQFKHKHSIVYFIFAFRSCKHFYWLSWQCLCFWQQFHMSPMMSFTCHPVMSFMCHPMMFFTCHPVMSFMCHPVMFSHVTLRCFHMSPCDVFTCHPAMSFTCHPVMSFMCHPEMSFTCHPVMSFKCHPVMSFTCHPVMSKLWCPLWYNTLNLSLSQPLAIHFVNYEVEGQRANAGLKELCRYWWMWNVWVFGWEGRWRGLKENGEGILSFIVEWWRP